MKTIGIIGGGNMGAAIIAGIRAKYNVILCEADSRRASMLRRRHNIVTTNMSETIRPVDALILAVKPQDFEKLLGQVRKHLDRPKLVISIAAGITTKYIEGLLGDNARVVRTMPNLPLTICQGMTGICRGRYARPIDVKFAKELFELTGKVVVVSESLMDTVTAVSGSGPAYVFYFAECWKKAARNLGLSSEVAKECVRQTMIGSLKMLLNSKEGATVLRQRVTSKGGTTQAAIRVLEARKFEKTIEDALKAAKKRAKELAR